MPVDEKKTSATEFAQQLFQEHFARCFWHLKPDLVLTETMIPLIIKGLRIHGGRSEFLAAAKLAEMSGR